MFKILKYLAKCKKGNKNSLLISKSKCHEIKN